MQNTKWNEKLACFHKKQTGGITIKIVLHGCGFHRSRARFSYHLGIKLNPHVLRFAFADCTSIGDVPSDRSWQVRNVGFS